MYNWLQDEEFCANQKEYDYKSLHPHRYNRNKLETVISKNKLSNPRVVLSSKISYTYTKKTHKRKHEEND